MSSSSQSRNPGLDHLRFFAIILVTLQHALSVLNLYTYTSAFGVSFGQTGVALFCAISGYLSFGRGNETVGRWFLARLQAIFPAYWLAMLFSFLVTWLFSSKDFTGGQFVSQMLGLGFYTHGWQLVNVVSWFISLILLCYVIAAVARWSAQPMLVLMLAVVLSAWLVATRTEVDLSRHILPFAFGGILRLLPAARRHRTFPWLLAVAVAMWISFGPQFGYSAIAGLMLYLVTSARAPESKLLASSSGYIYEYFLLHGIFLVGMTRFIPSHPLLGVAIAIAISIGSAYLLKRLHERLFCWFSAHRA